MSYSPQQSAPIDMRESPYEPLATHTNTLRPTPMRIMVTPLTIRVVPRSLSEFFHMRPTSVDAQRLCPLKCQGKMSSE